MRLFLTVAALATFCFLPCFAFAATPDQGEDEHLYQLCRRGQFRSAAIEVDEFTLGKSGPVVTRLIQHGSVNPGSIICGAQTADLGEAIESLYGLIQSQEESTGKIFVMSD